MVVVVAADPRWHRTGGAGPATAAADRGRGLTESTRVTAPRQRPAVPEVPGGPAAWRPPTWLLLAGGSLLAACVALRFIATSPLWLDEAQSVAIARLHPGALVAALRQDGSPPLYYFLLHGWIGLVGTGSEAVRALSGLCSTAALAAAWLVGRELRGRRFGWLVTFLLAANPWSLRYATETRMYALVELEVLVGALALVRLLRGRSRGWAALLAADVAALLLTHYWTFFLVGPVAGWLLLTAARRPHPAAHRWAVAAVVAGGLPFLGWLPNFLFQLRHTGTPWAGRPNLGTLLGVVGQWGGGGVGAGPALAAAYWCLVVLAVAGTTHVIRRHRLVLDLSGNPLGRRLGAAVAGPTVVAFLAAVAGAGAFTTRYTAIVVPLFVALLATGLWTLPAGRTRLVAFGLVSALGVATGCVMAATPRTQAGLVADELTSAASPGDVVAFCPDQLGPAVRRLTSIGRQVVYPTLGSPARVDWVDYAARNTAADPLAFAEVLDRMAGRHRIWLVWANGYRTFDRQCGQLADALSLRRGAQVVVDVKRGYYEHEWLDEFSGPPLPASAAFPVGGQPAG